MDFSLFIHPQNMALVTDLYQLTMIACYFHENKQETPVTFEYFLRPQSERHCFVFAGGEQALDYLEKVTFSPKSIAYLKTLEPLKKLPARFFSFLRKFAFQGEVRMVPEGTIVFPNEPLLQISGPLAQVQLVETYLLATLNFQTMIATKAARILEAAQGRPVFEFGTRRAHGPQAGTLAARASYIAGCSGTSNLHAGFELGIPVVGTAAHSFILSHPSEMSAFHSYYDLFQEHTTLLIDTYDTLQGARNACQVGPLLKGIRLDSGDLAHLSREVRKILDQAGFPHAKILASNDLNEQRIQALLKENAKIDAFGVGTELVTSRDQPALSGVYKLVEIEENGQKKPKMKFSESKISYPGKKQIFRQSKNGVAFQDLLALEGESHLGETLLKSVMTQGKRIHKPMNMNELQTFHQQQKQHFPPHFLDCQHKTYPLLISDQLNKLVQNLKSSSLS
ncbi:MAG: nicotinate phosphoribosyltransferase [Planctomycetota bacterium]